MKRIFVLTALLISFTGFSQSFTLNELLKLSKSSDDSFDIYVTKKGYESSGAIVKDTVSSVRYTFLKKAQEKFYITRIKEKRRDNNWISFETSSVKNYLAIKESLVNAGYALYDKHISNGFNFSEYKKGRDCIIFILITDRNKYKYDWAYEIHLLTNYYQ